MDALTNSINSAMSKCSSGIDDLIQDCESKGYNDEDPIAIHRSRSLLSKVQSVLLVPEPHDVAAAGVIEREGKDVLNHIYRDCSAKLNSFKDQKR
mmetsp:Transcript_2490/g.6016  ORF Transcript_2490/g.6016 Transcript_2490/m.6016 type:complete len:95 (+) Transcript_2490:95-379(+)